MKRICVFFLLIHFGFAFCNAPKKAFAGMLKLVIFNEQNVEFCDGIKKNSGEKDDLWNHSFKYKIETRDKINFLNLDGYKKSFLLLKSDEILILFDNNDIIFIGVNEPLNEEFIDFVPKGETRASSELREGKKIYRSTNLCNLNLCEPWAEGEIGSGIGTKISTYVNCNGLILFSGYVSYSNPKLFSQNSRPKKVKIILTENKKEYIYELNDTPNPQCLEFDEVYNGDIELIILDVYRGILYDDTCINSIMQYMRIN